MSVRANARLIPTFVTTLVMLVIPSSSTYSQKLTGQYLQTTWTTENGLPQNSVNAIVQTRDGYLWLATFGGLARFDGIRFTIFDTGNTPALKSTRIIALYEDSQGGLWIGGEFGGVARFASNQFTSWGTKEGMVDGKVNFISADREGNVWIGTDRGLARYRSGRFTTITQAHGYPGHTGIRMSESSDGSLWFLSEVGITQYRKGSFTNTWPIDVIYQANFIGLDETEDGDLLISSARALMSFRYGAGTPIAHYKTDSARESPGRVIRSFRERSGKLTFLTTSGLAHFRNGQINDYIKIPAISQLTENVLLIRAVIEDREGNIWIGTDGKGLHRIRKAQIDSYAGEEGLIDASFLTVTQDAEGAMWFLCDAESGPYRMSEGVIRNLDWKVLAGHGPRHSILHASDGTIWIGDYVQISVIRDGRLVDRIVLDKNPTAGIPIPAIFEDKDGIIWIGAATDTGKGGLYRFADGQLTLFRTNEGLVHNNVRRIMQDSHGALWIGTYGGLSCFKDGKFTNYTTENGLTHNYVREIYEATDGAIWLGTYGGGLLRMKDGKFVSITTRDGLFDNVVSRILEDDRGNFWMSCNRGIFRVSHKELDEFADGKIDSVNSVNYGVTDGMKSSECNGGFQPAGWKARDGTL